jgi:hypothetical protein
MNPTNIGIKLAAVEAVKAELWIIIKAAEKMANGYYLPPEDTERLGEAHDFILRVLDEVIL